MHADSVVAMGARMCLLWLLMFAGLLSWLLLVIVFRVPALLFSLQVLWHPTVLTRGKHRSELCMQYLKVSVCLRF